MNVNVEHRVEGSVCLSEMANSFHFIFDAFSFPFPFLLFPNDSQLNLPNANADHETISNEKKKK